MNSAMQRLSLLLVSAMVAGCNLAPTYERPEASVPEAWPEGAAYLPANAAPPVLTYQQVFQNPALQALIARALTQNQDLAVALANIEVASAQYRGQRALLLPPIDLTAASTRSQANDNITSNQSVQIGAAAYELDLYGRLRNLGYAAQQRYLASETAARAVRLTLIDGIAETYAVLAADRTLLAIAAQTQASAQKTVELTEARLNGGVASRGDLSAAQTVLQQALSDLAVQTTLVAQDRNALELLVGGPVADDELPASIDSLMGVFAEVPAGLDSQVLLARPDVAQAEHQLQAAYAQIGVARAAFFPTISLTALAGSASPELTDLFSAGSFTWRGGLGASLPLFRGGATRAALAVAQAQREAALAQYQKAIQTAFREVADALARRGTIKDQLTAQAALVAAANASLEQSTARYQAGIDPYLNTLVAQRTLYGARRSHAAAQLAEVRNLAVLYKTLGADPLVVTP
ncbi:MAG: efflux transporter outer membrane subunit [Pseudomonadales bacterium]|jgi:multidrug efflux system outer membrane protein|nr:efflux transporter outer membrane subunit [Pseudomonadales bacterium]